MLELDELGSFASSKAREVWRWLALCRRTRQVVAYTLSDRSQGGGQELARARAPRATGVGRRAAPTGLAHEGAFPARTRRFCGKEQGETNHAERCFGALRARLSRRVRRACPFSKRVDRHLDAIHLFLTGDNLRIKQSTSR